MAGLLRLLRDGSTGPDRTPVFVQTGGLPAPFANPETVLDAVHHRSGTVTAR
jgi:hypothetical protein